MNKTLSLIIKIALLVVCLILVIYCQRQVSYLNLALMLLGLCGILGLLYTYNKKYQ